LEHFSRKTAGDAAKRLGATVQNALNKDTDILIKGEGGGGKV